VKIFLDTAEIEEIRTAARWGVLDGVTTNPSLYAKVGGSYDAILQEMRAAVQRELEDVRKAATAEAEADDRTVSRRRARSAPNPLPKSDMPMQRAPAMIPAGAR